MSRIACGCAIKGIALQISSRDFETIEYTYVLMLVCNVFPYNRISL